MKNFCENANQTVNTLLSGLGSKSSLPVKTLSARYSLEAVQDLAALNGMDLISEIESALVAEVVAETFIAITAEVRNLAEPTEMVVSIAGLSAEEQEEAVTAAMTAAHAKITSPVAYIVSSYGFGILAPLMGVSSEKIISQIEADGQLVGYLGHRPVYLDRYENCPATVTVCGAGWLIADKNKGLFQEETVCVSTGIAEMRVNTDAKTDVVPTLVKRIKFVV